MDLYSRAGKPLSFTHISKALLNDKDGVYDGEIYDANGFQSLMKQARRKYNQDKGHTKYVIFDYLTLKEFEKGKSKTPLAHRYAGLDCGDDSVVDIIEDKTIKNKKELMQYYQNCLKLGYEGIMIKDPKGLYEGKRTRAWLKYKPIKEMDCRITKVIEGEGKYKGMLGAFEVQQDNKNKAQVGSGFSDKHRKEFWSGRKRLIGKICEVKYQEKTNDGIMRFPVFLRLRPDKD